MTASTIPNTQGLPRLISDHFAWVLAIWLHLAAYAILTSQPGSLLQLAKQTDPVEVEIVPAFRTWTPKPAPEISEDQTAPPPRSMEAQEEDTAALPATPSDAPPRRQLPLTNAPNAKTWVKATRLYAQDILNDKSNAKTRQALATLVSDEKWSQICALEAMEQIQLKEPGFRPTQLLPNAVRNCFQARQQGACARWCRAQQTELVRGGLPM